MAISPDDWDEAEVDPKLLRVYDHPVDGRYLLAADVVAWLRSLATVAEGTNALSALMYGPILSKLADTVEHMVER